MTSPSLLRRRRDRGTRVPPGRRPGASPVRRAEAGGVGSGWFRGSPPERSPAGTDFSTRVTKEDKDDDDYEVSTTDRLAELEAAKERLDAANTEREKIDAEYHAWEEGIRNARAELNSLFRTKREEFAAGRPDRRDEGGGAREGDRRRRRRLTGRRSSEGPTRRSPRPSARSVANVAARRRARPARVGAGPRVDAASSPSASRSPSRRDESAQKELLEIAVLVDGPIDGRALVVDPLLEELDGILEAVERSQAGEDRRTDPLPGRGRPNRPDARRLGEG